mgnify:CR=1 FL=1
MRKLPCGRTSRNCCPAGLVFTAGVAAALLLYPGLLPWRPLPGVSVLDLAGAALLAAVAFAPGPRSRAA